MYILYHILNSQVLSSSTLSLSQSGLCIGTFGKNSISRTYNEKRLKTFKKNYPTFLKNPSTGLNFKTKIILFHGNKKLNLTCNLHEINNIYKEI